MALGQINLVTPAFYINNYETIKKETNGIINDYHWSEVTHQNLSKFFIEIITNELKIEKKLI